MRCDNTGDGGLDCWLACYDTERVGLGEVGCEGIGLKVDISKLSRASMAVLVDLRMWEPEADRQQVSKQTIESKPYDHDPARKNRVEAIGTIKTMENIPGHQ